MTFSGQPSQYESIKSWLQCTSIRTRLQTVMQCHCIPFWLLNNSAQTVSSPKETSYSEIFVKHGFLQNGRHNSYQSYWYDSSTCDWSGFQDTWIGNVESILGKYEGKHGRWRSEVICTMCIQSSVEENERGVGIRTWTARCTPDWLFATQ